MANAIKKRIGHPLATKVAVSRPSAKAQVEPIPFYAKVKVEQYKGLSRKVIGRIGIVLGRAQLKNGRWNYSVFLGGLNESYSLPHGALKPTGEIVDRKDIHGGEKLRVSVDEQGAGTILNA